MNEFEKDIADNLGEDYIELINRYEGAAALHVANLIVGYGKNERKTLEHVVRIIELSTQMLGVFSGKLSVASDMPEEQVIKWTPKSETIQVNIKYLREKTAVEDARKLMIAVHTAVFMRHVRAVVESANETVQEYADKMGWTCGWKNPVDPSENPRLFLDQKCVKDALAYGIAYTESALRQAKKVLRELKEQRNE